MDKVFTTGRIRLTLEIEWPHYFGEKATAVDIYTTATKECTNILHSALRDAGVKYKVIDEVEPLMVITPARK